MQYDVFIGKCRVLLEYLCKNALAALTSHSLKKYPHVFVNPKQSKAFKNFGYIQLKEVFVYAVHQHNKKA
jgi:hypothetical protein